MSIERIARARMGSSPLRRCGRRLRDAAAARAGAERGARPDRAHRRHLRREPQLRPSLRAVPGRERHRQRDAGADTRRSTATASRCPSCRRRGRARTPIPRFRTGCRTGRSASTRRRSTCRCRSRCAAPCTSTTRTSSRSTAGATTASPRSPTPAATRWATTTASKLPLWQWAREYTLADNFFMAAFGGSYLNHQWLICACTPRDESAPASMRAQVDERGRLKRRPDSPASALRRRPAQLFDGDVTPGRLLGQHHAAAVPAVGRAAGDGRRPAARDRPVASYALPPQTREDDRRHAVGEGRDRGRGTRAAGTPRCRTACSRPRRSARSIYNRDNGLDQLPAAPPAVQLLRALRAGHRRSRAASQGLHRSRRRHRARRRCRRSRSTSRRARLNEHPGYTDVLSGDTHIAELIAKIKASPLWATIGDHRHLRRERRLLGPRARRPPGDRWGPGTRIPAIIVSPFAKRATSTTRAYDTTSIIKFITRRFGLEPLPGVRPNAGDLTAAFDFGR